MKVLVGGWTFLWSTFFVLSVFANAFSGMPIACAGFFLLLALPGWIYLFRTSNHDTAAAQLPHQVYDDSPALPPPGKASPNSTRLYSPPPLD
jgi:hypothetical protein